MDSSQKEDGDCAKMKVGYGSCSVTYPEYTHDRTSVRKNPAEELCCDTRPMYAGVLPNCNVPAKCESTDCLGASSNRNSCMMNSQCNYTAPTEFSGVNNGTEHYSYGEKQYKNKDLCAIDYPPSKCQQPLDSTVDGQTTKKLAPTIMPYPGSDSCARTDFYNAGVGFEQAQAMGPLHKSASNQSGLDMSDSGSILRRSDH